MMSLDEIIESMSRNAKQNVENDMWWLVRPKLYNKWIDSLKEIRDRKKAWMKAAKNLWDDINEEHI